MTHCNKKEFEAQKGYGALMSHPKFWAAYLKMRDKELGAAGACTLRLCFGHAGGEEFWFDSTPDPEKAEWGKQVYELCTAYPNVYCETGGMNMVKNKTKRGTFIYRLYRLLKQDPKRKYAFSKKLMFGTDWYMPMRSEATYLTGYQDTFRDLRLRKHYQDFFFNNAVRYLNIEKRIEKTQLPPTIHARLQDLVNMSR